MEKKTQRGEKVGSNDQKVRHQKWRNYNQERVLMEKLERHLSLSKLRICEARGLDDFCTWTLKAPNLKQRVWKIRP